MQKALVLALLVLLSGCSTLEYYSQAVVGQMTILANRRPVADVITDPATLPAVREKLELAVSVLQFAETELSLPVDGSYAEYVDTGREFVVWNVFAAPEFSLVLETSCFPIAGCVAYRGFFDRRDAESYASALRDQGFDVFVGGVAAYSTLGWFDDPILNTFLTRSDINLAALLFHELAHRVVYVPGDTAFNESFATAIEREALRRWLESRGNADAFTGFLAREARQQEVIDLIESSRQRLAALYDSDVTDAEKRLGKHALIESMRDDYAAIQAGWDGHTEFQRWMQSDINNARLGTIATYNDWVSSFVNLLASEDGDLQRFAAAVRALAEKEKTERDAELAELAD